MRIVKTVKQNYTPTLEILRLLDVFRQIVNHCIRIGVNENLSSLKALSLKAYPQLEAYNVPSYYKLCAISAATGILRNYRKAQRRNPRVREPYARHLRLTTCYGFKILNGQLRLPLGEKRFAFIPLNPHTLKILARFNMRSVTLTTHSLSIAFCKHMDMMEPEGLMGIDRNLDNLTLADTTGQIQRYDLSQATLVKAQCRSTKAKLGRNDVRIRQRLYGKYGELERNRVQWILHNASAQIVREAKRKRLGIVMERLTGIRRLYRKGNGQSRNYRFRLNSWSYAELQRQIEYKAHWEGLPVIYVPPHQTSVLCSTCGSHITEWAERKVWCANCRTVTDRDVNAARNILARGLRFKPVAFSSEAMVSVQR